MGGEIVKEKIQIQRENGKGLCAMENGGEAARRSAHSSKEGTSESVLAGENREGNLIGPTGRSWEGRLIDVALLRSEADTHIEIIGGSTPVRRSIEIWQTIKTVYLQGARLFDPSSGCHGTRKNYF